MLELQGEEIKDLKNLISMILSNTNTNTNTNTIDAQVSSFMKVFDELKKVIIIIIIIILSSPSSSS